jgi:hypothetical protein
MPAALLPPAARDHFLRSVAGALGPTPRPSDREIAAALRLVDGIIRMQLFSLN